MKNIKGLLVIVLLVAGFAANAQFKFGVGGGLNIANLEGNISGTDSRLGFNGGFIIEVKLPVKIGFEADVLFSTKGANNQFPVVNQQGDLIGDDAINLSYIDLPVVIKIYMAKVLSFQLGAQYSMLLGANFFGSDLKDELKASDLSAVVGLGLDVLKLHVSARYNYGLTSIDDTGIDLKNNMFTFTVGVWIK